jgi:regulator of sigma E protease
MILTEFLSLLALISLDTIKGILGIAAVFTIIVGIHELGHFLAARWRGMEVEEFAIGFGKRVLAYTNARGEVFSLRIVPLGGFVRIKGMEPKEDGSEVHVPGGFYSKGLGSRALVLAAGPFASIFGGLVITWLGFVAFGKPELAPELRVASVEAGSAAQEAGLRGGDVIFEINGKKPDDPGIFRLEVQRSAGAPVNLGVRRGDQRLSVVVRPRLADEVPLVDEKGQPVLDENKQPKLGKGYLVGVRIEPVTVFQRVGVVESAKLATSQTWQIIAGTAAVFTRVSELKDNVGGPITIGVFSARAAQTGLASLVLLAAIISISLGLVNLLPIPPLDGGQLLIVGVEAARGGRRLSFAAQNAIAIMGFVFVVFLVVAVFSIDINRWVGN